MSTGDASKIDEKQDGLHPRVFHQKLLRLPAVIMRIGLHKTAVYKGSGGQNYKPVEIGVLARAGAPRTSAPGSLNAPRQYCSRGDREDGQ
jgi:hypothetical protein